MDPFFFSSSSPSTNYLEEFQLWYLDIDPSFDPRAAVAGHHSPPPSTSARGSAFSRYAGPSTTSPQCLDSGVRRNILRRVIELARRIHREKRESKGGGGSSGSGGGAADGKEQSRGFRHMMRERQRRERLSQSYANLYAMLPPRTKADKNSIVQMAAMILREMKEAKEGLQRRNEELVRMVAAAAPAEEKLSEVAGTSVANNYEKMGGRGLITLRAENPAEAIDSVIATLRCLERMDVKARAIRSKLTGDSGGWMTTYMNVETNKVPGKQFYLDSKYN
ncbi:hypothetical protein KSP40_PGU021426 [Platanthera guangdongensis]|uniref:BHLH domain-containing protein n=1 Tax=Platanthera guangdongensis TaxID=2320717 RepID=A0ABR2M513_9ASPA